MTKDLEEKAIGKFYETYGMTPRNSIYPIMDVSEKMHLFLYGTTPEAIKAYKRMRRISSWMIKFYAWPGLLDIAFILYLHLSLHLDIHDDIYLIAYLFGVVWLFFFGVLFVLASRAQKKSDNKVVALDY